MYLWKLWNQVEFIFQVAGFIATAESQLKSHLLLSNVLIKPTMEEYLEFGTDSDIHTTWKTFGIECILTLHMPLLFCYNEQRLTTNTNFSPTYGKKVDINCDKNILWLCTFVSKMLEIAKTMPCSNRYGPIQHEHHIKIFETYIRLLLSCDNVEEFVSTVLFPEKPTEWNFGHHHWFKP